MVFRYLGPRASLSAAEAEGHALPRRCSAAFGTFFAHCYTQTLAQGDDLLCRDFAVFLRGGEFALLAVATPAAAGAAAAAHLPPAPPNAAECRTARCMLHVLRLADGAICDSVPLDDDRQQLLRNCAASLLGDRLAILSVRALALAPAPPNAASRAAPAVAHASPAPPPGPGWQRRPCWAGLRFLVGSSAA